MNGNSEENLRRRAARWKRKWKTLWDDVVFLILVPFVILIMLGLCVRWMFF